MCWRSYTDIVRYIGTHDQTINSADTKKHCLCVVKNYNRTVKKIETGKFKQWLKHLLNLTRLTT